MRNFMVLEQTNRGLLKFGAKGWREDGGDGKVSDYNADVVDSELQQLDNRVTALEAAAGQTGSGGIIDAGTF